jgi:hypothetical protein
MRRTPLSLLLGITLLTLPIASYSTSWAWLVQKSTGKAIYSLDGTAEVAVQKGLLFERGSVHTGDNGKVVLVRNEESVFIGPYTVASIAAPAMGLKTTVNLLRGQASFAVGKKSKKHFSVDTPFMAAVVKGTRFEVTVRASSGCCSWSKGCSRWRWRSKGDGQGQVRGTRST